MKFKKVLIIFLSVSALVMLPFVLKNSSFFLVNSESLEEIALKEINISLEDQIWDLVNKSRLANQDNQQDQSIQTLDQAWKLAETINDQELKNNLFNKLIQEYLNLGAFSQAISIINNPAYYNEQIDYNSSLKVVGSIKVTQAYLKNNQADQALAFVKEIKEEAIRYQALTEIIKYDGENGKFDEGIKLILTYPKDSYSYEQYLSSTSLIEIYAKNKQFAEALAFINTLETNKINQETVEGIAGKLIELALEAKEFTIAEKTIEKIKNNESKVAYFKNLAEALIKNNDLVVAQEIVNKAFILDQKNEYFNQYYWAEYFLAIKEENKVKTMLEQLSGDEYTLASDRNTLANAYVKVGNLDQAFALAKLIPPRILLPLEEYPDPKDELLQIIFDQALAKNDVTFAQTVISEFGKPEDQVNLWQKIANYHLEKNQNQEAITSLNQGLEIAKKIESISIIPERSLFWSEPNANLLINLAKDYHKLGEHNQALSILEIAVKSIQNFEDQFPFDRPAWTKTSALIGVANVYLEMNESSKVLPVLNIAEREIIKLLDNLTNPTYAVQDLLSLSKLYDKLKQETKSLELFNKAMALTKKIDVTANYWLIYDYLDIALTAIELQRNDQALVLINEILPRLESIEETGSKISINNKIIALYIKLNQFTEAEKFALQSLDLIKQTTYKDTRIMQLQELAVALTTDNSLNFALKMIPNFETREARVKAIIAIAKYYQEKNNYSLRDQAINLALKITPTIYDLELRQQLETEINDILNIS